MNRLYGWINNPQFNAHKSVGNSPHATAVQSEAPDETYSLSGALLILTMRLFLCLFRILLQINKPHQTGFNRVNRLTGIEQLFADFGFEKQSDTDGNTVWMLKTAGYTNKNRYIDVPQEETDA